MRAGVLEVREAIGNDFTEKEIQDALWYYFYDVAKCVSFLLNSRVSAAEKNIKKASGKKVQGRSQFSLHSEHGIAPGMRCSYGLERLGASLEIQDTGVFDLSKLGI